MKRINRVRAEVRNSDNEIIEGKGIPSITGLESVVDLSDKII